MANIKKVTNRSASVVVYRLPERNIRREFRPGESREIEYDELVALSYLPGGRELMEEYLQVESTALDSLALRHEPEYNMSADDVVVLLLTGSLDALLDCLDFAPSGVIELVKKFAVELPVNDVAKRQAIKEKTGFDVSAALTLTAPDQPATASTTPIQPIPTQHRRTSGEQYKKTESKYKVVES